MTNILYSIIYLIKYYLLYFLCRLIFITCYRLCTISEENSKMYNILYQQNYAIFKNQTIELLSNQILEYQQDNREKNKKILSSRLEQFKEEFD